MSVKLMKFGQASVIAKDEVIVKRHMEQSNRSSDTLSEILSRLSASREEALAAAESDPFTSRIWNFLAWLGGLPMPLGERDFKEFMKRYGSMDMIRRKVMTDEFLTRGYMLHSHENPYDLQMFFQKASLPVVAITFLVYFLFLSSLFAALATGFNCIPTGTTGAKFIPTGFFLISGLSSLGVSQTSDCLWIESFAVLTGVYVSLPIFGAFVLIRLLDNSSVHIKLSDHVLLIKRGGRPTILFRMIASNGLPHTGVELKALFYVGMNDEETGEKYAKQINVDVMVPNTISFSPANCVHVVEENSPLLKYGVIIIDERGIPRWNHKKIGVSQVCVAADKEPGARKSMICRMFYDSLYHLVDAHPETGAYPTYVSVSIASMFNWRTSEGKISPASDMSKFHQWEYSKVMTERWELQKQQESEAALKAEALEGGTDNAV